MTAYHLIPGPDPASATSDPIRSYLADPLGHMSILYERYGDVVALVRGGNPGLYLPETTTTGTVFAFGPKQAEVILRNPTQFHSHSLISPLFPECENKDSSLRRITTGLFSHNGSVHQCQRKKVMPPFQRSFVETFSPDITCITAEITSTWDQKGPIDLAQESTTLALAILWHIVLGEKGKEYPHLLSHTRSWLEHLIGASKGYTLNLPDNPQDRVRDEASSIEATFRRLWQEALQKEQSILTQLCRHAPQGAALSETEGIGHLFTFVMAGYETVASSILWTLFLLASHPNQMAQLTEEIEGHLNGGDPSAETIRHMTYLDHVIKESLRVLPAAPICWRIAQQGAHLGPWEIPAGTEVIYSPFHIHHLAGFYDQPNTFSPDRWATLRPSAFEYLPFSAGPRKCIGASLATHIIKGVLIYLLPRYHFQLPDRIKVNLQVGITLQPAAELPMKIIPRHLASPTPSEIEGNIRHHLKFQ